ncbi:DUF7448 domain-containing protein [Mammaliicoccus sciuri]|uniref:DUF7448 domain-containing protein n=1 Tax=Mammaliicoccus sciuri TaxID=1296 RepID=UPI001C3C2B62|nr:hypothetical protein [Mammaliicoccus sciuri]MBV5103428.1 hypothetical protein [Mammaliicoccus sciuri]
MHEVNYAKFEEIKKHVLYKRVTEWTERTLTLDDGTLIEIVESEQDCCAHAGGRWKDVKLDAVITNIQIEDERVREVFDDQTEGLANVVIYHNQNPIAQGECSADAGNGNYYYSVCSLKIKGVHYPVVEH